MTPSKRERASKCGRGLTKLLVSELLLETTMLAATGVLGEEIRSDVDEMNGMERLVQAKGVLGDRGYGHQRYL